ncbi:DUF262 domain-containing protein [bacterium]|nr:DUF262 domain-containing protein [bacterium]
MKKSLRDLLNEKEVIIPIIQRDYAQGRNNEKALSVRSRLIDDWRDILLSDNKQMDFNFVYGNENQNNIFFPVDGQQRLTSLYLLYWYFSFCNLDLKDISRWKFEYKTRNSASEFFDFLKNTELSKELFEIIKQSAFDKEKKEEEIKDKNWFKIKWENDPTIMSAITFLILLSEKLKDLPKDKEQHVWVRLNETDITKNAIVFTYLPEQNQDNSEVEAAKKYTRMNARGKKLTDFENLKAMVDEIESFENSEKPLSNNYDKIYIHKLYKKFSKVYKPLEDTSNINVQSLKEIVLNINEKNLIDIVCNSSEKSLKEIISKIKEETLKEIVSKINEESLKWYKMTFLVYSYIYSLEVPSDLLSLTREVSSINSDLFENRIYKISQKRIKEPQIKDYLIMVQAVQEVLYNVNNEDCLLFTDFDTKTIIAFITFVSKLWTQENSQDTQQNLNINIYKEWKRFENCLLDLDFNSWVGSNAKYIQILNILCEGIKNNSRNVNEYFFAMKDSDKEYFDSDIIPDFYSRLTEQQIKSSLLINKQISDFNELNTLFIYNDRRLGYFYYITGCLNEWEKNKNTINVNKDTIKETKEILENLDFDSNDFLKGFAYTSQCNENGILNTSEEINRCNNFHIWKLRDLYWTDNEYHDSFANKEKTLLNLKKFCDLLKNYLKTSSSSKNLILDSFIKSKILEFEKLNGYESCWLRFALKSQFNTKELLSKELENPDGDVLIDEKNYILYCYLTEMEYKETTSLDIQKKISQPIFTMDIKNFDIYGEQSESLSFPANPEGDGKYKHSYRDDLDDLSGNITVRNLDLKYKNIIKYKPEIHESIGAFKLDEQKNIHIQLYSLGEKKDRKRILKVSSTEIKYNSYKSLQEKLEAWKTEFSKIHHSPEETGSWDKWIELWFTESAKQFQFENSALQNTTLKYEGTRRRPMRTWIEYTDLSSILVWNNEELLY